MCVRAQTNTFRWFMLTVPATYCEACDYTVARRCRKLIMKKSVANQNRDREPVVSLRGYIRDVE